MISQVCLSLPSAIRPSVNITRPCYLRSAAWWIGMLVRCCDLETSRMHTTTRNMMYYIVCIRKLYYSSRSTRVLCKVRARKLHTRVCEIYIYIYCILLDYSQYDLVYYRRIINNIIIILIETSVTATWHKVQRVYTWGRLKRMQAWRRPDCTYFVLSTTYRPLTQQWKSFGQ